MPTLVIAGDPVEIGWTRDTRTQMHVRASKLGIDIQRLLGDFTSPTKAEYAVCAFIWLLLPRPLYLKYEMPEDLYGALDPSHAEQTMAAVGEILQAMSPSDEKKST